MDLTLKRTDSTADGIFSDLLDPSGNRIACTLEHAYDSGHGDGSYAAKVQPGTYKCVRGQHQLHGMKFPFTTFEITGVVGHTDILFHVGNYNRDSEGCVLLGDAISPVNTLVGSKDAFNRFMLLLTDIDNFKLTVI